MSTDRPETQADAEADLDDLIFGELVSMRPRLFLWSDYTEQSEKTDILWVPLDGITSVSLFGDTLEVELASSRTFQTDDPDTIQRFLGEWEVV